MLNFNTITVVTNHIMRCNLPDEEGGEQKNKNHITNMSISILFLSSNRPECWSQSELTLVFTHVGGEESVALLYFSVRLEQGLLGQRFSVFRTCYELSLVELWYLVIVRNEFLHRSSWCRSSHGHLQYSQLSSLAVLPTCRYIWRDNNFNVEFFEKFVWRHNLHNDGCTALKAYMYASPNNVKILEKLLCTLQATVLSINISVCSFNNLIFSFSRRQHQIFFWWLPEISSDSNAVSWSGGRICVEFLF